MLNRAERRREDRKNARLMKWLNSLNRDQRELMAEYCTEQSRHDLMIYFQAYERVLRPYVYEHSENELVGEKTIKELIDKVQEEGEMLVKLMNRGENYMAVLKENKDDIIAKYEELKNNGVREKEIYEELNMKFSKITPNSIKNIILEYKRDLKKNKEEEIQEVKSEENQSKYQIISEKIVRDIKGQYHVYHIDNKVMEIDEYSVCREEDIKDIYTDKKKVLIEQLEEIKKQLEILEAEEFEAIDIMNIYMGK